MTPAPCSRPSASEPRPFTASVPNGNGPARRVCTAASRSDAQDRAGTADERHADAHAARHASRPRPLRPGATARATRRRRRAAPADAHGGVGRAEEPRVRCGRARAPRAAASRTSSARRTGRCRGADGVRAGGRGRGHVREQRRARDVDRERDPRPAAAIGGQACSSAARARPPAAPPKRRPGRSRPARAQLGVSRGSSWLRPANPPRVGQENPLRNADVLVRVCLHLRATVWRTATRIGRLRR